MIPTAILNFEGLFFLVVTISIIGLFLAYGLSKKEIRYADNIGLKNLEILTITNILLLFNTTNQPLPVPQMNPSINYITYIFTVALLLIYVFYTENKVGFEKDKPINKFRITKILLNKVPRILFSIVLILWVGSNIFQYILQPAILLGLISILLYYILAASIIYILFTFFYIFFIEIFIQESDKKPKKKHKKVISIN